MSEDEAKSIRAKDTMVVHKTIVATNSICNALNKTGTLGKLRSTNMGIRVILSQGNLTRKMVVDIMHY